MISSTGIATLAEQTRGQVVPSTGKPVFEHKFRELLGLDDPRSHSRCVSESEQPEFYKPAANERPRLRPTVGLFNAVIEGLLGSSPNSVLSPQNCRRVAVMEALGQVTAAEEVVPSQFLNISPFNSAVTGLLEARILESFQQADFIGDMLAETIPTRKMSEKYIGISKLGDQAEQRKPGVEHKRVDLSEVYTTTPDLVNRGLAIDVTREANLFDITGQLLTRADSVGELLGLRREYLIIDEAIGHTSSYNRNGTSYSTYNSSGGLWVNKAAKNFADWTDYDEALQLFAAMTDPDSGEPINVGAPQVLCMPAYWMTHRKILNDTVVETRTASAVNVSIGSNPVNGAFQLLPLSQRAYLRVSGATGLNAGATNGPKYWYLGNFKKAFKYHQALPLTVVRANPDSYTMADKGLILSIFADEMGIPCTVAPWNVCQFINE